MMTKMTELNRELILDELSNFEQKKSGEIPHILNKYLESIAQNGDTMFSWNKLQPLLKRKLEIVMNEFNELCPTDHLIPLPNVRPFDFEELKQQILTAIDTFCSAPFTIQRICELITNPSKHYKRTDKFMRGIEKNILVVTTVEPKSADGSSTQYSTSSFKNLFSSLHSTSNSISLSCPSTSLLVNGMTDICDQQMAIHCSNDSELHHMSSPVSPNSMPLSTHSSNSPPNPHLAPLQQLDSFTTVFVTAPTPPLSVVSDLHNYDHSSSLSLMTSSTSGENLLNASSEPKITETTSYFETNASPQTDINFSNNIIEDKSDTSLQITSATIVSESKVIETNQSISDPESSESKPMNCNENTLTEDKQQSSQKTNETTDDITDKSYSKTEEEKAVEEEEIVVTETKTNITSNESSIPFTENKTDINVSVKSDNCLEQRLSDNELSSSENKPLSESANELTNNEIILNLENSKQMRITNDEEMNQPMDDLENNTNTENNTDMTDCSDSTNPSATHVMEQTSSLSDLSEPMDED